MSKEEELSTKKGRILIIDLEKKVRERISIIGKEVIYYSPTIPYELFYNELKNLNIEDRLLSEKRKNERQDLTQEELKDFCKRKKMTLIQKEKSIIEEIILNYGTNNEKKSRTIVIGIMGNVDSGKTTLFSKILEKFNYNSSIKEDGGITQKIRSFLIEISENNKIGMNFVDTPGHSVFSNMRENCSSFIDMSILVIDAGEGVKNQTVEVIEQIRKKNIPAIVFINEKRIGDYSRNVDRIMSRLESYNISKWSGEFIFTFGSALEKKTINDIVDCINIMSEQFDWKASLSSPGNGIVIDSFKTNHLGNVNKIFIKEGLVKPGDWFFSMHGAGKILNINNQNDLIIKEEASAGEIVNITGVDFKCYPGENFVILKEETQELDFIKRKWDLIENEVKENDKLIFFSNEVKSENNEKKTDYIDIILIADTNNSLSSVSNLVKKISKENFECFNIIISETNSMIRENIADNILKKNKTIVVTFGININSNSKRNLKNNNVEHINSKVIYEIEKKLIDLANNLKVKERIKRKTGELRVIKIFNTSPIIIGCQSINGVTKKDNLIEISEEGGNIQGWIESLEKDKNGVNSIKSGENCGIIIKGDIDPRKIKVGYKIHSFEIVEK